jgi:hypothetical protein
MEKLWSSARAGQGLFQRKENSVKKLLAMQLGLLMTMMQGCGTFEGARSRADLRAAHEDNHWPLSLDTYQNCENLAAPQVQIRSFRHRESQLAARLGGARHRVRDLIVSAGGDGWVIGKFAYGVVDKDIHDETIHVFVAPFCGPEWRSVGTFRSTWDEEHATEYGIKDNGGRVYLNLKQAGLDLQPGRHKVAMVVEGDGSNAVGYIDVLPDGAKMVVTDVDGTLTAAESDGIAHAVLGKIPEAHPGAAEFFQQLSRAGYHIVYLTARPEWMTQHTHSWLKSKGFPRGSVHTTVTLTGLNGEAARNFKAAELRLMTDISGSSFDYAFGNKDSDVKAFADGGIAPQHSYYFNMRADSRGGNLFKDYRTLTLVQDVVLKELGQGSDQEAR